MFLEAKLDLNAQPAKEVTLVVDDEPDCLSFLVDDVAGPLGCLLIAASDSKSAIEALEKGEISKVLCDGLDGDWRNVFETAKERGVRRFALYSANRNAHNQARNLGIEVFEKPVDLDVLINYFSS